MRLKGAYICCLCVFLVHNQIVKKEKDLRIMNKFSKAIMKFKSKVAKSIEDMWKARCLIEIDNDGKKTYKRRRYALKKDEVIAILAPNEKLIEYKKELLGE